MTKFTIHTVASAPEGSKPLLEELAKQVGFIPNLAATMAESPITLEAFTTQRAICARGSLTPLDREAVALAVSFENSCTYCMAAHSTFATMNGIGEHDLKKLRSGHSPVDQRLQALSTLARKIVHSRGHLSAEDIRVFLEAGFTTAQVLEVAVGINMIAIANYIHQCAQPPVDEAFKPQTWASEVLRGS